VAYGTKIRNVRISDDVWIPAMNKANRLGDSVTNVIRRGLQHYIEGEPPFDADQEAGSDPGK
jgi:hypothetical protein